MRPVPLNLMTLYADLAQNISLSKRDAASIAIKTVKQRKYVYATSKDGGQRIERYLGPADDPEVMALAERIRQSAQHAKQSRNTVTLLKRAGIAAPSLVLGRILEVLANAGLFERGVTLVGTAAYQAYSCIVGGYLEAATLMTNDVDLSVAEFVAAKEEEDINLILKRADSTFEPQWGADDILPTRFKAANGFSVDILTAYGRGRTSPIQIKSLGCAAVALSFQEYPAAETMEAIALYGTGIKVRVPTPQRYAIHKLIVAQLRKSNLAKRQKDLLQARELIEILLVTDEAQLQDALDDARDRGKSWKTAINKSLSELGCDTRQGYPPLPRSN
jgi:hypothetical protein